MTSLKPHYDQVQAIYDHDHTTELLDLFLDSTLLYSCAYFERDTMTLEEAQIAKLDLALGKCDLHPGQTLLEIGCGWGAGAWRAATKFRVNVIALTLSESQLAYCTEKMQALPPDTGHVQVRLLGWEEFHEPVDRIVSIAAFEHFGVDRHAAFFQRCSQLLPPDGRMLLHTIVAYHPRQLEEKGIALTHQNILFLKFMAREIFPGGYLINPYRLRDTAEANGLNVVHTESLQSHYARTLGIWADNLRAHRSEAIRRKSRAVYDRYMRYLTGCADHFSSGHIDVWQFTMTPKREC
jgi:cyclopropane-fatty-acyl-phospholipid synthase